MLADNVAIINRYYNVKTNLLPNNAIKKVEIVQNSVSCHSLENSVNGKIQPQDITEVDSDNIALLESQGFSDVEMNTLTVSKTNDYPYPQRTYNNVVFMKDNSEISANCKVGEYTFVDMLGVNDVSYVLYSNKSYPFMDFRVISGDVSIQLPLPKLDNLPTSKGVACALSHCDDTIYLAIATESAPYLFLYSYNNGGLEPIQCTWSGGLSGRVIDIKLRGKQGLACLANTSEDRNFIVFDIVNNSFVYKDSHISGYYPICVNFLPKDNSYGVMGGVNYCDRYINSVQYQTAEPYRFYVNGVYSNMLASHYSNGDYTSFDTANIEYDGINYSVIIALMSNCVRVFAMDSSGQSGCSYTLNFSELQFGAPKISAGFDKIKLIDISVEPNSGEDFQSVAHFDVVVSGKGYQSQYSQYYKTTMRFAFDVAYEKEPFGTAVLGEACKQYECWEHGSNYTNSIARLGEYIVYIDSMCSASGEDEFMSNVSLGSPIRLYIEKEQTASMRYVLPNIYGDVTMENYQLKFNKFTWGRQSHNTKYGDIEETNIVSGFLEAETKGVDFNKNYIEPSILLTQSDIIVKIPNVLIYSKGKVLTESNGANGFNEIDYYSGLESFNFEVLYGGLVVSEIKTTLGDENNKLQVYQISGNNFYEWQSVYELENLAEHNAKTILNKWNKGRQYLEIEVPIGTYRNEKGEVLIGEYTEKQEFAPYDKIVVKTRKGYPFIHSDGKTKVFEIMQMMFKKRGYLSMLLKCMEI